MRFQDDVEQLRKVEEYAIGDILVLPIDENQEAREQLKRAMPTVPNSIKEKWAFDKYPIKQTVLSIDSPVVMVGESKGYYCVNQGNGEQVFLSLSEIKTHLAQRIKDKWGIPSK